MFRRDLLSDEHVGLREAADKALAQLEQTIRAKHVLADNQPLDSAARAMLLAAWSIVHGFAHLLLDGKLAHMHADATSNNLLENVLPEMLLTQWPD
jgi:hypothetical protein